MLRTTTREVYAPYFEEVKRKKKKKKEKSLAGKAADLALRTLLTLFSLRRI